MKKIILSAVAAAVIASPMAAAPALAAPQRHQTVRHQTIVRHQPGRTVVVRKNVRTTPSYRHWAKGQRFDRRYAQNYREIDYRQYRGRRLYAPPRGYHWVRSGNDAVLVALASGLIGAVIGGALN